MKRGARISLVAIATCAVAAVAGCSSSASGGGTSPAAASQSTASASADPSLAALVPASIKGNGTIDIATPSQTPPEEFNDESGALVGYEIDVITAVVQKLGLKPKFALTPFSSIIPGMQAKRYYLAVGQFGVRSAREQVVDMVSVAQLNEGFGVLKSSGITSLTLSSLCGHTVAVVTGSVEQGYATDQSGECTSGGKEAINVQAFADDASAWLSVQSRRSEVYWSGNTAVGYAVKTSKVPAAVVGTNLEKNPTAILVQKGSDLAPAVQKAMQQLIDSGQYASIMAKWGVADAAIKASELNPTVST